MLKRVAALVGVAIAGFVLFVLPALPAPNGASLFAIYEHAVNWGPPRSLIFLFPLGCVLGAFMKERALVIGLASVALLPTFALVQMVQDSTSHNLFPIEFAFYALYGMITAAGAALVQRIRKLKT